MTSDPTKLAPAPERSPAVAAPGEQTDQELLHRFVTTGDSAAFTELVQRHGPLVLGVCERALQQAHDAEDAFQATFWILARKAHTIRKWHSLANWLHGVAHRVARKARAAAAARHARETAAARVEGVVMSADGTEVRALLDDELQKLPDKYRLPLLLCYLQGKTQDQASAELGWAAGVLRGRLDRGRTLLRQRLTRRGLTEAAVAVLLATLCTSARAAVPPTLLTETIHSALSAAVTPLSALGSGPVSLLVRSALASARTLWVAVIALTATGGALALYAGRDVIPWWALGGPSRSASVSTPDLHIELHPELADLGVTFEELSRTFHMESDLFHERKEYRVALRFRTSYRPLGRDALEYTLFGADGQEIGGGPAPLTAPLTPGSTADCTIDDPNIFKARRLVLRQVR
jgi:RNA polymerase sigma factor (sigma-70 family)